MLATMAVGFGLGVVAHSVPALERGAFERIAPYLVPHLVATGGR